MAGTVTFRRTAILSITAALTLLATFIFGVNFNQVRSASSEYFSSGGKHRRLHLLLPTTSSNNQLCKFLLSSGIVGFPEPTFLGWGGHGMYNGTTSRLFKVSETLTYLRNLPAEHDDDLVLLIDAYDVWPQMPPEIIISRYHSIIDRQNERLKRWGYYGAEVNGVPVRNSVIFGADKICWPQSFQQPACWAVPNSTMAPNVFGPDTDVGMFKNRPRWLNSGTVMGPVRDVRDVFSATMDMISRRFDESFPHHDSDQYYLSEVWAEQELRRLVLKDGAITPFAPDSIIPAPPSDPRRRIEFGITVDSGSDLFLTNSAYDRAVTWMRYNHSTSPAAPDPSSPSPATQPLLRTDQWLFPADLTSAPGPFSAADIFEDLPRHLGWGEVMLASSMVRGEPFPVLHLTGDASLRDRWWPRLWFHPHGERLLRARKKAQAAARDPHVFAEVDGVRWSGVRPAPADGGWDRGSGTKRHVKGGGWTDRGEFVPFEVLCGEFEDEKFYGIV